MYDEKNNRYLDCINNVAHGRRRIERTDPWINRFMIEEANAS